MMMELDLETIRALLVELGSCDELIADRGPFKVLPRPLPNVPAIQARVTEIKKRLQVKRKSETAKGPDLDNEKKPIGFDLKAVGTVEALNAIQKGQDRALPKSTTIVRVMFPAGEHLWFDPSDLTMVKEKAP